MRLMQIEAIYQKPNLSLANMAHKIYLYLLRNTLSKNIQVWSTDITADRPRYMPIKQGFLYVCGVVDWYSRLVILGK
jgi:putative transposase